MSRREYSDSELRSAYRALVDDAGIAEQLDADRIWDAVAGAAPVEERRKVVDEMARHPGAVALWRLARELQAGSRQEERREDEPARSPFAPAPRTISSWRRARYAAGALAAAALVVVAVGTWVAQPQPGGSAQYRAAEGERLRPEMPRDRALDRDRAVLRWSAAADGARYDVRVMSESLVEVASARDLPRPELALAAPSLRALPPGARILWQVTAHLPSGGELRSQTFVSVIE